MIQEVKEHNDEGNPYNARKPWIDYEEKPRGIAGANDGLAYKVERKTVVSSLRGEPPVTQETPEPETPVYSQVDYKKRYDDLKKHYDSKLNEFRQKETEYEKKLLETVPKLSHLRHQMNYRTLRKVIQSCLTLCKLLHTRWLKQN